MCNLNFLIMNKQIRNWLAVFFAVLIGIGTITAQEVTIGDGTLTQDYTPFAGNFNHAAVQTIYTADEVGLTGNITSVAYYATSEKTKEVKIYMGQTDKTVFSSTTDWVAIENLTLVYDGDVDFTANDWTTISLQTPFLYEGTDNLVIAVLSSNTDNYAHFYTQSTSVTGYRTIYKRNDNNAYTDFSGTANGRYQNIPNVKLNISPLGGDYCYAIETLAAETSSYSATVTWVMNENNSNVPVNLQYTLANDEEWENAITVNNLSGLTYNITDLTPNTAYKARIQSVCGEDNVSPWKQVPFRTACVPLELADLPYTNGFNSAEEILCWSAPITNGTYPSVTSSNTFEGDGVMRFNGDNLFVSPQINTDIENLRLVLNTRIYTTTSEQGTLEIGVMSDPTDLGTFESVEILEEESEEYHRHVVSFADVATTGAGKYIAFLYSSESAYQYWYVDEVEISEIPSCTGPEYYSLEVSEVTSSSAKLTWQDNNEANNTWVVIYKVDGDDDSEQIAVAYQKELTITNLLPSTTYKAKVYTVCGEELIQENASPDATERVKFTTTSIPITAPVNITFEEENANQYFQVTKNNNANENAWIIGNATATVEGEHSLYISNDGETYTYNNSGETRVYATMLVNLTENPKYQLSFDWKSGGETSHYDWLSVYLLDANEEIPESNPTGDKLLMYDRWNNYTTWQHQDTIINGVANATKKIVFVWRQDGSAGSNPPAAIDNIVITPMELSCDAPSGVIAGANATTATISWTESSLPTTYTVYYKESSAEEYLSVTANASPVTIEGLTASTTYQVYVQSMCDEELVSDVATFTTTCASVSLPWSENFDEASTLSPCMAFSDTYFSFGTANNTNGRSANSGSHYIYAKYGANSYVFTPAFELTAGSPYAFSFMYITDGGSGWTTLEAGLFSAQNSSALVSAVGTPVNGPTNTTYTQYRGTFTPEESGTYYIGIHVQATSSPWYLSIDDLSLYEDVASCETPSNVTASEVTSNEATITWNENNGLSTSWTVYYKPSTADTYTASTPVEEMTVTLTGLTPETEYSVYVKGNCSEEAVSNVITFTTDVYVPVVNEFPYTQNFEATYPEVKTGATVSAHNWYVGTATATVDGEHSLYVSNNEGESNSYATSGVRDIYASIDVNFGSAAEYILSFDWKGKGEANWDFLNVYVLDRGATFPSGKVTSNANMVLHQGALQANWTTFTTALSNVQNTAKTIVFHWRNDSSGGTNPPAAVDNISIVANNCLAPNSISVAENTTTSTTIVWEDEGDSDTWTLEYKLSDEDDYTAVTGLTEQTYIFTNLQQGGVSYDVRISGNCGENKTSSVFTFTTLSCLPATSLTTSDLTSSSATVTWTEVGTSTSWTVYYKQETGEEFTLFGTVESPTASLTGLNAYTLYNVKVVGSCSEENEATTTFRTLCGVYTLPYTQNFDATETYLPECWEMTVPGAYGSEITAHYPWVTETGSTAGNKVLEFRSLSSQSAMATSPNFGVQNMMSIAFSAKPKSTNGRSGSLEVGIITDPEDLTTFSPVQTLNSAEEGMAWKQYNVIAFAPAGATETHVAFRHTSDYNTYWYVVDDLNISAVSSFAVEVNSQETEEGYILNATYPTYTNIVASGIMYKEVSAEEYTVANETSVELLDLAVNTTYTYKSFVILADGTTIYSAEGTFTTACVTTTETVEATICAGETYTLNGQSYAEAGTYSQTLANANEYGCDSIITVQLTVNPLLTATKDITVCYGETATFNGESWTETGTYTTTVEATTDNCDTLYTVNVTVLPQNTASETITVCYGEIATFNGQTLVEGANTITVAGQGTDCDTLYTVTLNVLPQNTATVEAVICAGESYTFNGQTWDESGSYTVTVAGQETDCDTLYTINLTVNPLQTATEDITVCYGESYTFNGQTWNESGSYTLTVAGTDGDCDTVYTINLTVRPANAPIAEEVTLNTAELPYTWRGEQYSEFGTYTVTDEDENGCPQEYVLTLVHNSGIAEVDNEYSIALYPNPTSENATLSVKGLNEEATVIVTDQAGRVISTTKLALGQETMEVETSKLASGVYYIRIQTANSVRTEKLIRK